MSVETTERSPEANFTEENTLGRQLLEASLQDGSASFTLAQPNNSLMLHKIAERQPLAHIEVAGGATESVPFAVLDRLPPDVELPISANRSEQALFYEDHTAQRVVIAHTPNGVQLREARPERPHYADAEIPPLISDDPDSPYARYWEIPWGSDDATLVVAAPKVGEPVIISLNYAVKAPAGLVTG